MRRKQLYQQLTSFLNLKSDFKTEVTAWYDDLNVGESISNSEELEIQRKAKERIRNAIRKDKAPVRFKYISLWTAAAMVLILGGYLVWSSYYTSAVATSEDLAQVAPAKERAIITMEDGLQIDLDSLAINQNIQVGQTVISKDEQGRVSYRDVNSGKEKVQKNTLYVPKASTYTLTLVDGTRVTLNSDSKLTYPSSFEVGNRTVQLEGEGYFEVARTSNQSKFIVQANKQRIEVLGTKFNIKSYSHEGKEQTTLVEGSVKVSLASVGSVLLPHEQVTSKGQSLEKRNVDIDEVLGWTKGQFCFDGTNTEEVLREIARWYDIDIVYQRSVNETQYKGKIPRNLSLDKLIKLLNYAELKIQASVGSNKRIQLTIT